MTLVRTFGLAIVLSVALAANAHAQHRFENVERVVAFGDVHGAYERLTGILQHAGVIDADARWTGGRTHLVSTGDLVDRGDDGRRVIELLMRLESEAAEAGGRVHVLLGNHEVMNLTGDLRYVSAGDYEAFGGADARRAAFSADGAIGRWLHARPFTVVIDDTAFVHGGLSTAVHGMDLDQLNQTAQAQLATALQAIAEAEAEADADTDTEIARPSGLPFDPDGPVWYRGNALCHPYIESETLAHALRGLRASRVAVGHTVTEGRRITSRLDGRVLRIDTGMHPGYGGRPSALVIEDDGVRALYQDDAAAEVTPEPPRVWARPHGMDDAAIERFLREADIVGDEEIGSGVTRPRRLTLERDDVRIRAAFKTLDTDPGLERRSWRRDSDFADRYVHEVAAYKLDRLLGLHIVPPAVIRTVDGVEGAVVYWLEDMLSESERLKRGLSFRGHCSVHAQVALMNAFHVLIRNVDPNLGNILYDRDWQLWSIDHSRAFGTQRDGPSMIRGAQLNDSAAFTAALRRVTRKNLRELEPYLHRRQIIALIARAETLINR